LGGEDFDRVFTGVMQKNNPRLWTCAGFHMPAPRFIAFDDCEMGGDALCMQYSRASLACLLDVVGGEAARLAIKVPPHGARLVRPVRSQDSLNDGLAKKVDWGGH
jgi:hypothetical protein